MKKILSFTVILFIIVSCQAQEKISFQKNNNDNTLLWEVTGNGLTKPSFLYGTFHMLCKDDIHFSLQLQKAVKESDHIYMEIKLDDPAMALSSMQYMTMKDGKILKDLYSDENYERVQNFFKDSLKMPLPLLQNMKPFFLVSLLMPNMMDCQDASGVEMELIKLAKEDDKEIKGLETIQFQASIFDSIPYEWQAQQLLNNIDSLSFMKEELVEMINLYKAQNLDSLAVLINKSEFAEDQYSDILLANRNQNWVAQLDIIMQNESVLVAVGAGHLPGAEGVISLLRKKGYTVTPLENVE